MTTTGGPGWGELLADTGAVRRFDKDEVKEGLPLEWVLLHYGVMLEPSPDGRLIGPCPFHDDSDPSFALWGEGHRVAGCWVCDFKQGDVFDVVGRFHSVQFKEALGIAGRLLDEFRADGSWRPMAGETATRPKADPRDLTVTAGEAWVLAQRDQSALLRLIDEKQRRDPGWARVTAEFLHQSWFVGAEDDWTVVVPHYSDRLDGQGLLCRAIKTRTPRSHLYARAGSDLADLYGAWRLTGKETVLLVEGESDAWCASAAVGERMDVLGLPSGANARPSEYWLQELSGKHVVIAFDGDLAGRTAAAKWHRALVAAGAKSVRVATLPDGHDLSSCPSIEAVVDGATLVLPLVGNVEERDGTYWAKTKDDARRISNWSLNPERELTFEDGTKAYEGRVLGVPVVLRAQDCETDGSITRFSASVGGNWLGTKQNAQSLLGMLESQGPFLARGRATTVAGWHEGNFVWPGGRIGPDYWRHVPPASEVQMENLRIVDAPWDRALVEALLTLHLPAVMCPILAWMAAAPLRSLFRAFPFLAVTGTSGSGKTTLVEAVLDALGWRVGTTLTATTPHAVHSFAGATNGIPVWFDEYRPGAREDALLTMNQVLRDAYDGTPSYKGGARENKMALTAMPTSSPLVVTGEDAFSETSHIERMVLVNLSSAGRDASALRRLRQMERGGLGHAYLSWLVGAYWRGELPSIAVDTTQGRIATNMAILGVGWSLLEAFHGATTGRSLPAPDWSLVERGIAEAAATDPITDALAWAVSAQNLRSGTVVWFEGNDVMVKVTDFVREAMASGQFTLPGNRTAIGRYLDERWGAMQEQHSLHGRVRRLPDAAGRLL